jgi:hypothetical protein
MGYCYDHHGRLCCDICGEAGGARKYACPFGYCQATAACKKCRAEKASHFGTAAHREYGCERAHKRFAAQNARRAALLEAGHPVRCSALVAGTNGVHVLFDYQDRRTVGYYMSHATYDAIPLLEPATPDDYRAHGELRDAPSAFDFSAAR